MVFCCALRLKSIKAFSWWGRGAISFLADRGVPPTLYGTYFCCELCRVLQEPLGFLWKLPARLEETPVQAALWMKSRLSAETKGQPATLLGRKGWGPHLARLPGQGLGKRVRLEQAVAKSLSHSLPLLVSSMLCKYCWPETSGQKETQMVHPKPHTLAMPGAKGPVLPHSGASCWLVQDTWASVLEVRTSVPSSSKQLHDSRRAACAQMSVDGEGWKGSPAQC